MNFEKFHHRESVIDDLELAELVFFSGQKRIRTGVDGPCQSPILTPYVRATTVVSARF
jgi:hypothetical protein